MARWISPGSVLAQWMSGRPRATNRSSSVRRQATVSIGAPVLAASVAGPIGSVVASPHSSTGTSPRR